MLVYTTSYDTCCGDTLTEVFDSLDAVITRLKLMEFHNNFDQYETLTIKCSEIATSEEMKVRLKRVKNYRKS